MNKKQMLEYDLGWDYARYEWDLPFEAPLHMTDGHRAFLHGGRRSTHSPNKYEKKWLQIRFGALRRDKPFDKKVTPQYLEMIAPNRCPVTLEPFTYSEMKDTDWSVERADNERGYERGNLIIISVRANKAKSNLSAEAVMAIAAGKEVDEELSIDQWRRLAEIILPMVPNDDGQAMGVGRMVGQRVVPGARITLLAKLQGLISGIVFRGYKSGELREASMFLGGVKRELCAEKQQRKAFNRLIKAVSARAVKVRQADRVWGAERVQKSMDTFYTALGEPDKADQCIHELFQKMDSPKSMGKPVSQNRANATQH